MRCYSCNNLLTPTQAVRKFKTTDHSPGGYVDMCDHCLAETQDAYKDLEVIEKILDDEELFNDDGEPVDEE